MGVSPSVTARADLPPLSRDGDGNHIRNEILRNVSRKHGDDFVAKLEFMRLQPHQVLHEAGETLKSGYFCNTGMFSVQTVMGDGKGVEVGLIGKEGFAGIPLVAGFRTSHTRTVVQIEATAFRVDAALLRSACRDSPELERQLQRYSQFLGMQVSQVATCNRLHEATKRLAKWLLMTQDRIESNTLQLTQEIMAEMLGTRRSTVTVAAGILHTAGLIEYARGSVTILNRRRLEEAACDCYRALRRQTRIWQGEG
jgi:CRP-like cAMP-binding protein